MTRADNETPRRIYLVARDGERVVPDRVPATGTPETTLDISFTGLTEAEQHAALAAFPGGKRFRLRLARQG